MIMATSRTLPFISFCINSSYSHSTSITQSVNKTQATKSKSFVWLIRIVSCFVTSNGMSLALCLSSGFHSDIFLSEVETARAELSEACLACHLVLAVDQFTSPELMLQSCRCLSWETENEIWRFLDLHMLNSQDFLCGAGEQLSQSRSLSV